MEHSPSVKEVRAFGYTVFNGAEPSQNQPIGRLYIEETKDAISRSALVEIAPDYGFRIIDAEGSIVAIIAPGMWPYVQAVIAQAAELHSPACVEDNQTKIGAISVMAGF